MKEEQFSLACLIVGIMSCVLCCICLGLPLGLVGVVLFILSTGGGNGVNSTAALGLALSIVGFILSIISIILFIIFIGNVNNSILYRPYFDYNSHEYNDDKQEHYNLPYYFENKDIDEL